MEKDFDIWNKEKKLLHKNEQRPFYHEREVWWVSLGMNIGHEQDGTGLNFDRPVVILKGFNKEIFFGVALTGRERKGKYYMPLGNIDERKASAVLSQVRTYDTKRLVRKITTLDDTTYSLLKNRVRNILFPKSLPPQSGGEA